MRLWLEGSRLAARVEHALVSLPLDAAGLAARPDGEACRPLGLARDDDAQAALVRFWQASLADPDRPHGWLLAPVRGAREVTLGASDRAGGLRTEPGSTVVCFQRPVPDWEARVRHPELWPAPGTALAGAGAFRRTDEEGVLARVGEGRRPGSVMRVEIARGDALPPPDEAGFDLAVLYGRQAARALAMERPAFRMTRIPAWDAVYALWLDRDARWTNDPAFRRWLSHAVDREGAAAYVFGEQAAASRGLTRPAELPPPPAHRPFSSTSLPRLELAYDGGDRHAAALAARVKAVLEREGVAVRLAGDDRAVRPALVLLAHRPPVEDPLLALLDTLWPLGESAAGELRQLERATRIAEPRRRRERAAELEAAWIGEARLVPFVRHHAWLARRPELSGVEVGPFSILGLERAERER